MTVTALRHRAGMAKLLAAGSPGANADNALHPRRQRLRHGIPVSRVLCDAAHPHIFEGAAEISGPRRAAGDRGKTELAALRLPAPTLGVLVACPPMRSSTTFPPGLPLTAQLPDHGHVRRRFFPEHFRGRARVSPQRPIGLIVGRPSSSCWIISTDAAARSGWSGLHMLRSAAQARSKRSASGVFFSARREVLLDFHESRLNSASVADGRLIIERLRSIRSYSA